MNRDQHAWLKLAEECAEVSQRVIKLMQFGPKECEPGQELTNLERVQLEYADIQASVARLTERGLFDPIEGIDLVRHINAKNAKVDKYLALSMSLGQVVNWPPLEAGEKP